MIKKLAITIYCCGLIYGCCVAGESDYQHAKKQEQLVASFWQADGSKYYSGEQK